MGQRLGRLALAMTVVLAGAALGEDDTAVRPLFDGRSLDGWTCEHTDGFRVRDGVIVNTGGTGWLRHHKSFRDFELHAEYRAMKKGADSGLLFRASAESAARAPHLPVKGYQLQIVDSRSHYAIYGYGVAPPKFHRSTDALDKVMKGPGQWQTLFLKVVGSHAEARLNGTTITVSDTIERREGCIGLQAENGHFEWRGLKIKELPAPSSPTEGPSPIPPDRRSDDRDRS